jgi:hypothetical protein
MNSRQNIFTTSFWNRPVIYRVIERITWWAFLLFMFFLPVTSFPYFPPVIGGGALVRPLSIYPLIVLAIFVILPRLFQVGKPGQQGLPRQFLPLGIFLLITTVSGILSLLQDINPSMDISSQERVARVFITLILGVGFYLAVSLTPRSLDELRGGLRALYLGMATALAWSMLQLVYVIHFNQRFYHLLDRLQDLISTRRLIENRISGMTYEPNWFGEQITILLVPWLLASILTGSSVFRWRWRWLTIEMLLLAWSLAILPFTFSRAGLINLAVLIVVFLLFFRLSLPHKSDASHPVNKSSWWKKINFGPRWFRLLVEVLFVLSLVAGGMYIAATRNETFGRLWNYWERPHANFREYLMYIGFEARMIYGETAYNIYEVSPWFGVGPGNYGLYFAEQLPYRPLARTPEVIRVITPEEGVDRLITAKNFFLRLLAETGILGTAAFIVFFITILVSTFYLWLSPLPEVRFWGLGGVMALIVFLFSTLSFDSFAIPNMWVVFGLVTSAYQLAHNR